LSERLFAARLDLVRALDDKHAQAGRLSAGDQAPYGSKESGRPPSEDDIRADALKTLQDVVAEHSKQEPDVAQPLLQVARFEAK
jgi:type I restriction enzyme R subunit